MNKPVAILPAFAAVVLVWATTPLAIKFSAPAGNPGISFYDAVAMRMLLAVPVALLLVRALGISLSWGSAWRGYAAGALGIYGGLIPVYYASQLIPSGMISVIYGLSPILSSLMAARWLDERALTPARMIALVVALSGLLLVFRSELGLHVGSLQGLVATLASVTIFTFSGVLIKRQLQASHPLAQTAGTLVVALPLYLLTWLVKDGSLPQALPLSAMAATAYLAILGSVLSFGLYFYILQYLPLSQVALTTLVSPVLALFLGMALAGEQPPLSALAGSVLILGALVLYQLEEGLLQRQQRHQAAR